MKKSTYCLFFACMMLLIFGGVLAIRYVQTGDILIDQLIGVFAGATLFVGSIVWKKRSSTE